MSYRSIKDKKVGADQSTQKSGGRLLQVALRPWPSWIAGFGRDPCIKLLTLLDVCASSLRGGHVNILLSFQVSWMIPKGNPQQDRIHNNSSNSNSCKTINNTFMIMVMIMITIIRIQRDPRTDRDRWPRASGPWRGGAGPGTGFRRPGRIGDGTMQCDSTASRVISDQIRSDVMTQLARPPWGSSRTQAARSPIPPPRGRLAALALVLTNEIGAPNPN